ncbi:WxcM-like domain-containing protein [Prevotella sp. 10(H)]|uniref:WxcM-like domain-containing protein n=1 Tax=Prevotella sp. 10(H) TaxID=1158294 RepID=UPI00055D1A7F|nr:WxcM-like domain-containing protein [Prevotella sp. 10(H)]
MEKERFIELPQITDRRGNLSFMEAGRHIPFSIGRTCWIYNIGKGQKWEDHKSEPLRKLIISLSGNFEILISDGEEKHRYTLDHPNTSFYIPEKLSFSIENFSSDAVCLIITSDAVNENSHIADLKPKSYTVEDCSLIKLPEIENGIGNSANNLPFDVKRIFYIYDIPIGKVRGMHAHKLCHEVLVAANGSFEVELDDGVNRKTILLDSPDYGLYIPPGIWATERNYASGTVCLALASDIYDKDNYINAYPDFLKYRQHEN